MDLLGLLERSDELHEALATAIDGAEAYDFRWTVAQLACTVAWQHASGLRLAIGQQLLAPAVGLLRLQYEAFARAAWVGYAASDEELRSITPPFTPESEKAAKDLPTLTKMVEQLGKCQAPGARPAYQMLSAFKGPNWGPLNSYVHTGIHPLVAAAGDFPERFATQILRFSNALAIGNMMIAAVSTGDQKRTTSIEGLQHSFLDCCPDVIRPEE